VGLTLDRNHNIQGWHRHTTDGLYKSIAIISGDETDPEDVIYLCVQRTIGGATVQYIETMMPLDWGDDEEDCFFVHAGVIYDYTDTNDSITGATQANPVVITAGSHPFTNGNYVRITGVVGMTQLNGNVYTVKNKA